MRKSNNGTSWEEVFQAEGYIEYLTFLFQRITIFLCYKENKIYRSTDGGDSWLNFANDFPRLQYSCISSPILKTE